MKRPVLWLASGALLAFGAICVYAWGAMTSPPSARVPLVPPSPVLPLRVAMSFDPADEGMARHVPGGPEAGFLPEFARELARQVGRPPKIMAYTPAELYASLERGEADVALAAGLPPPGLEPYLRQSIPWASSGRALLLPAGAGDLAGMALLVKGGANHPGVELLIPAGSPGTAALQRELPAMVWRQSPDVEAGLRAILQYQARSGRPEAASADFPPEPMPCLVVSQRQALLLQRAYPEDLQTTLGVLPGTAEEWRVAFARSLPESEQAKLNQAIEQLRAEGWLRYQAEQHLAWELREFARQGVPYYISSAGE